MLLVTGRGGVRFVILIYFQYYVCFKDRRFVLISKPSTGSTKRAFYVLVVIQVSKLFKLQTLHTLTNDFNSSQLVAQYLHIAISHVACVYAYCVTRLFHNNREGYG